jgi:hypothetical protein
MNPLAEDLTVEKVSIRPCQIRIQRDLVNLRCQSQECQAGSNTKIDDNIGKNIVSNFTADIDQAPNQKPNHPTPKFLGENQEFSNLDLRRKTKLSEYSNISMISRSSSSILGIVPEADPAPKCPRRRGSGSFYQTGHSCPSDKEDNPLNLLSRSLSILSILPETDDDVSPDQRPHHRGSTLDASMDIGNLFHKNFWDSVSELSMTSNSLFLSSLDRSEIMNNFSRSGALFGKSPSTYAAEEQDQSFAIYSRGNLLYSASKSPVEYDRLLNKSFYISDEVDD